MLIPGVASNHRGVPLHDGNEAQLELYAHLVGVSTSDPSANRWFLVVADADPVTRLRVEVRIPRTRAVADPRLDDKIRTNRLGVVPQVVLRLVHN
jgi:hypothetical protein